MGVPGRDELLDAARSAYAENDWTGARSARLDADATQPLDVDDLERLAWSCRWSADEVGFLNALELAEVAFGAAGARPAAARMALEQARQHVQMLDESVAITCFLRAAALLGPSTASPPPCASGSTPAGGDEVLVSADLVARCAQAVAVAGERTLELKGITEPVAAVLVDWDDRGRG
jgi:hypothetical protein